MSSGKKPISVWGHKYNANQLNDALQNNRTEFFDLCRRVTCNETAAKNLIELIEKILDPSSKKPNQKEFEPSLLDTIRLKLDVPHSAGRFVEKTEVNSEDAFALENETNLIQILAQVHMMAIAKGGKKILYSK